MTATHSLTENNTSHLHRCPISSNVGLGGFSRSIAALTFVCEILGIMIYLNSIRTIHLVKLYNDLISAVVGCANLISVVENNSSKKDIKWGGSDPRELEIDCY